MPPPFQEDYTTTFPELILDFFVFHEGRFLGLFMLAHQGNTPVFQFEYARARQGFKALPCLS
jgi:hypothetical protein